MGHSRGGYGSKFHVLTGGKGLPLRVLVSAGQEHDGRYFKPLLQRFHLATAKGYVKTRPKALAADKAYDSKALRDYLSSRGIRCVIPQWKRPQRKPGRPRQLDKPL